MRTYGTLVALAAASAAIAAASPAAAEAAQTSTSGSLQLGPPTLVWQHSMGPVTVDEQQGTAWFSGGIDSGAAGGTLTIIETIFPDGRVTDVGTWTGGATVGGVTGELTLDLRGGDDGTAATGTFIARGSGALAGLRGKGTYTDSDTTGAGSYTLSYVTTG